MTATKDFASSHDRADTQVVCAAGEPTLLNGQLVSDTQHRTAVEEPTSPSGQGRFDTQRTNAAGGPNFRADQGHRDTHTGVVGPDYSPPTLNTAPIPSQPAASGLNFQDGHSLFDTQNKNAVLDNPLLGVLADVVDDLEKIRIANENRLRQLTNTSEHGHGLTLHNPDVARLAALVDSLKTAEHQAILNMNRVMRAHPLWKWAKPIQGIGEKQFARLLAEINDPYWNYLHNRPRLVSELWTFCGYHVIRPAADQTRNDTHGSLVGGGTASQTSGSHRPHDTHSSFAAGQTSGGHSHFDTQAPYAAGSACHTTGHSGRDTQKARAVGVAPKRQRGQRSNWNEDARQRAYLIAESLMKQQSIYREIYDQTRAKYAEAVHAHPCVRCGPKGKPAQPGSQLSRGHQHGRALRKVAKEFLKDLWRESKRLHQETGSITDREAPAGAPATNTPAEPSLQERQGN